MMDALSHRYRSIAAINGYLLGGAMLGVGAVMIWPDNAESWPFGLMSLLMGPGALIALTQALMEMLRFYRLECALAEFAALGGDPTGARLASTDDLRKAGMVGHDRA